MLLEKGFIKCVYRCSGRKCAHVVPVLSSTNFHFFCYTVKHIKIIDHTRAHTYMIKIRITFLLSRQDLKKLDMHVRVVAFKGSSKIIRKTIEQQSIKKVLLSFLQSFPVFYPSINACICIWGDLWVIFDFIMAL